MQAVTIILLRDLSSQEEAATVYRAQAVANPGHIPPQEVLLQHAYRLTGNFRFRPFADGIEKRNPKAQLVIQLTSHCCEIVRAVLKWVWFSLLSSQAIKIDETIFM